MKRVTLDSLAADLGISKYSVSRALGGKRGVSEQTRKRVLDAARAVGYEHAAVGSRRRAGGQDVIVLLIPHQDVADVEFWMGIIAGAGRVAEDLGYKFVTRPLELGDEHTPVGVEQIAGVIVAGSRARPAMRPYLDAGVAVAMVTYPRPLEPIDIVGNADDEGGIAVARHLIELGHRRLAFVTEAPDKPSFAARSRGFTEAAAAEGLAVEQIVIDPERPGATFERQYRELAKRGEGPTGVFASTDAVAFAVAWALGRLGLHVPRDVSLVGFNDGSLGWLETLSFRARTAGLCPECRGRSVWRPCGQVRGNPRSTWPRGPGNRTCQKNRPKAATARPIFPPRTCTARGQRTGFRLDGRGGRGHGSPQERSHATTRGPSS